MILTAPSHRLLIDDCHLTVHEIAAIESNPAAMRAMVDGSTQIPAHAKYIKMYGEIGNFCGAIAALNVLPNPLQVEWHLFYLSTAPLRSIRIFMELAYIYAVLHRWQPYTVVRDIPELRYMHNFMHRMGAVEIIKETHRFYIPPVEWEPKFVSSVKITYE